MRKLYHFAVPKKLILVLASFIFINCCKAQPTTVYADPAVGSFDITTTGDVSVNANGLLSNTVYKLKLDVLNLYQSSAIPDNTCQITIGLGSLLKLDPAFDLSNAPYANYFTWSSISFGGQVQIFGVLHTALPVNFVGQLSFNVRALTTGTTGVSTATANFSVINNNPNYLFSDLFPNNTANIQYQLAQQSPPLPVSITKLGAVNKNCSVNVNWSVAQELNLSRYEVEMSKDGINYFTVATVAAQNKTDYSAIVPITDALKAPVLFVRLKNVDIDGSFKYSSIITVAGTCSKTSFSSIYSYPNPVRRDGGIITIASRETVFNGSYQLVLSDMAGKIYSVKTINLSNVISFNYETGSIPASGQYILKIQKTDGSENNIVQFEKL